METLGQNCRRRVAETEAIVSSERQKLCVDMEVLEQKQRQLQDGITELSRLRREPGEREQSAAGNIRSIDRGDGAEPTVQCFGR